MPSVLAYHRPKSLNDAASLIATPGRIPIGGGTAAVPAVRRDPAAGVEIVDLQALGLDMIIADGDRIGVGATTRLSDLRSDLRIPSILRDLARRELPSALRNQATVGGTIAYGSADSVLIAGLLAHDATIEIHGESTSTLTSALAEGFDNKLITSVTFNSVGVGSIASTGRTPADMPIVAAVAVASSDGVRLSLTGVARSPILVDPSDPTAGLTPPGDFRGSSEYRLHLAALLSARAIEEASR